MSDIMCQFRRYIVQNEHAELSKKLEELTFQSNMSGIFAKYSCSCCLLDVERENEDFRLDFMLMCAV